MKGINLKKIGAIVAGATILASSVAFAGGLKYQNTELVNENGEPLAKVVIGANSVASDGVVAALISNKMANEAYKSTTLTAEVVGEATCTGGAEAEGTCDIVEGSETVTLEVTVPGAGAEGVHSFTTAIGDYVDRELQNRWTAVGDSDEGYTDFSGFDDIDSNPFQDTLGDAMQNSDFDETDLNQVAMYDIGANNFGVFRDVTIKDTKAGKEYTEKQDFWVHGNTNWDDGDEEVYGQVDFTAYTALLDSTGDYGLPVCPGDTDEDWVNCEGTLDALPAHKVFINFMGEDWVISEVENIGNEAQAVFTDEQVYEIDGARVSLARESVSGIVNVGEIMEAPSGYKVRLDDISREVGFANAHPAIITVLDANDNEICQDQVWPGETKDDLCEEHTDVKLHVYQTAPGLNFIAKWAEMAIYKDEIELESGEDFLDDSNTEWEVTLGWTNKDDVDSPQYWRNIILWNEDEMEDMEAGDVYPVTDVEHEGNSYEKYDLTYNGIDSEDVTYDDLKFKVKTPSSTKSWEIEQDGGTTCEVTIDDDYLEVTTNEEFKVEYKAVDFPGPAPASPVVHGDTAYYIDVIDSPSAWSDCGAAPPAGSMWLIVEDDDGEYYLYDNVDANQNSGAWLPMEYRHAGSDAAVGFYAPEGETIGPFGTNWTSTGYMEGGVVHSAGKWDDPDSTVGDDISDALSFMMECDLGDCELGAPNYEDTPPGLGEDDEISYVVLEEDAEGVVEDGANCNVAVKFGVGPFEVLGYESAYPTTTWGCAMWPLPLTDSHYDEGFISMRGTEFKGGSDSEYQFKVPDRVMKTTWTFSTVEAAEAEPDMSTFTLHEGEETTVGTTGVTVKAVSIDQELTPCTMGTGTGEEPACTPDMSTVSAVIMPDNAPSVDTIVPYSLTSNLVYLDTDNVALDTGVIVTVGGDAVNTVTKDAIAGSEVDFEATPVVVKQLGNKIVVAGYSAEDTMAAGEQFLSELTSN